MPREWISRTMPWPVEGGGFPNKAVSVTPKVLVTAYGIFFPRRENSPSLLSFSISPPFSPPSYFLLLFPNTSRHQGTNIRFWDASGNAIFLLHNIHVEAWEGPVTAMALCPESRTFAASTECGMVLVYKYFTQATDIEPWVRFNVLGRSFFFSAFFFSHTGV
jgi:hypothetical protein